MTLDVQAEQWLRGLADSGLPPLNDMPVPMAREVFSTALADSSLKPCKIADISDRSIPGPNGDIPIRIYTPEGNGAFPILVYFHGGGWVLGNLDGSDGVCTLLAKRSGAVVVSVAYRLAPEHPAPGAAEDCYSATKWVSDNAALINGDSERIAVGGESAGGNLAAVVALMSRNYGTPNLQFQLLMYPVVDYDLKTPSYHQYGNDYFLTTDMMRWFFDNYANNPDMLQDWRVSPLRAPDLSGLPATRIITAEYDPTRDGSEAYASRLVAAGTTVTLKRYQGQIHGFTALAGVMGQGKTALEDATDHLREVFRQSWEPRLWLTR
ncbi:alpha/beta hydrolase [Alkalihalobacterium alkalinitrilicum]|uniref:alpha/beta hydrolase n=1 Tax=Alkalihalobacterium alkalinitrilicum TaxID=427920 RepID=UPI0009954562|nr:alpha/beta hydrolase [Alkalihalobacterium alkalinitrilicum]